MLAEKAYQFGYRGNAYDDFPIYVCGDYNMWTTKMTDKSKLNYDKHQDLEAYYIKIAKSSHPDYAFKNLEDRAKIEAVPQKSFLEENHKVDRTAQDSGGIRVEASREVNDNPYLQNFHHVMHLLHFQLESCIIY